MTLEFTTPLVFVRVILTLCELYAIFSFVFLFLPHKADPKNRPHWAGRLRTLALWHLLVPPVLYGLQFLLPALWTYILGLLLMMLSLHILREWCIDRDNRWNLRSKNIDVRKLGCLPHAIVSEQIQICFGLMSLAIYNILLLYGIDPLLDFVVSIGGTVAWIILDFVVMNWLWQRRQRRESFKQLQFEDWAGTD